MFKYVLPPDFKYKLVLSDAMAVVELPTYIPAIVVWKIPLSKKANKSVVVDADRFEIPNEYPVPSPMKIRPEIGDA